MVKGTTSLTTQLLGAQHLSRTCDERLANSNGVGKTVLSRDVVRAAIAVPRTATHLAPRRHGGRQREQQGADLVPPQRRPLLFSAQGAGVGEAGGGDPAVEALRHVGRKGRGREEGGEGEGEGEGRGKS